MFAQSSSSGAFFGELDARELRCPQGGCCAVFVVRLCCTPCDTCLGCPRLWDLVHAPRCELLRLRHLIGTLDLGAECRCLIGSACLSGSLEDVRRRAGLKHVTFGMYVPVCLSWGGGAASNARP